MSLSLGRSSVFGSSMMGKSVGSGTGTGNGAGAGAVATGPQPVILFNISKKESFTPSNGFRTLQRRLRGALKLDFFSFCRSKDDISASRFTDTSLLVFGNPKEKFSNSEFEALKTYLARGGSILYLASEGGESTSTTNFNFLLEEYGMMVNSDSVVRTVFYKYSHPKEAFISNGVVNREINKAAGKTGAGAPRNAGGGGVSIHSMHRNANCLNILYPYGATLTVQKPAVPILSSGTVSYPLNRPVGAAYIDPDGKGKIVVIGSADMFSDRYIEKEENSKLLDVVIKLLTTDSIQLNAIDANDPDISDYHYVPDTVKLSETVRSTLLESEEIPKDFSTMFDLKLFQFDTSLVPKALDFYHETRIKRETLSLIQPQVIIVLQRDDDDLEYYIRECAGILGITPQLDPEHRSAKDIMFFVMHCIVDWKKLNLPQQELIV
ncbi:hypothetical protein BC829DRAFT_396849 [Chytridium lagenaria]|nr:hypothetical protein BC829DRAFT_396849 [Chytridium lagenaria]